VTVALALLRHGDTAWSAEGRIQGRTDVPLSDAGRDALRGFQLPAECRGMRVVCSPLARCVETAALISRASSERDARIAEMSWGAWEGRRLADLRAELGPAMEDNEARGWDFRPQGGESPREVLERVRTWLAELREPTLAITHRGVIRAIFAAACGWNLCGKPPAKLDWSALHLFRVSASGMPMIDRLNVK
jgi:broad specificity phosphatase PhoE